MPVAARASATCRPPHAVRLAVLAPPPLADLPPAMARNAVRAVRAANRIAVARAWTSSRITLTVEDATSRVARARPAFREGAAARVAPGRQPVADNNRNRAARTVSGRATGPLAPRTRPVRRGPASRAPRASANPVAAVVARSCVTARAASLLPPTSVSRAVAVTARSSATGHVTQPEPRAPTSRS